MSSIALLADRLAARWNLQGLRARPGVKPEALRAFEHRYGIPMPTDMSEFLLFADGMDEMDTANSTVLVA